MSQELVHSFKRAATFNGQEFDTEVFLVKDSDGTLYPVLFYEPGYSSETYPCPYCGQRHSHSKGEGHRAAHCPQDITITLHNGMTFRNKRRGYILKEA